LLSFFPGSRAAQPRGAAQKGRIDTGALAAVQHLAAAGFAARTGC